ncbi:MAG: PqqD family protein [Planctomycetota bacterium]
MLGGIPHLHPNVTTGFTPRHGYTLSWVSEGAGKHLTWWRRLLAGPGRRYHINLDEIGRRTIELIDGERSVREIAAVLAGDFELDQDKATAALIVFLTQLMQKNAIQIVQSEGEEE